MIQIYFLIFWIPAIASAVSLLFAWSNQILRRPILFLLWFGFALLLQIISGMFSPGWALGLFLQAALGVYLGIRLKLDL